MENIIKNNYKINNIFKYGFFFINKIKNFLIILLFLVKNIIYLYNIIN